MLYTSVEAAFKANDLNAARRALAAWRGVRRRRIVERRNREARHRARAHGFVSAGVRDAVLVHRAAGARGRGALSRCRAARARNGAAMPRARIRRRSRRRAPCSAARRAGSCGCSTGFRRGSPRLSFAIVGDFEDAGLCWRTQAKTWAGEEGGEHAGIVLASGAGALGVLLGGPIPSVGGEPERAARARSRRAARSRPPAERGRARLARARALALLMLLLTLANWAP